MKAPTNSIVGTNNGKKPFSAIINSASSQSMIKTALGDPRRAASFTSTLISAVSSNEKLAECRPETVISSALKGEAMDLSLQLQQFSIVPYGDTANFQISYKGMSQLATRSGQYKDFDVFDVREGEYKGRDRRTREPVIEWLDDDVRAKLPIVGYYGFYELKNGFSKAVYWTHDAILDHANRYSKAFKKDMYDKMVAGKLDKATVDKLRSGTPWYDDPSSLPHIKMCRKTVLLQMLGDGTAPLSIEMRNAIEYEKANEAGEVIFADSPLVAEAEAARKEVQAKAKAKKQQEEEPVQPEVVDVEAKVVSEGD